jgi:acyl-coenzyme A synthetase/AMP-(fatty) acid ligase
MLHAPVFRGPTLIIMPRFHLENFCSLVQEHRATFAYLAPPVVLLLAKDPIVSKYDLSSLQIVASAAAPLSRELGDAMYEWIKIPIKQGYGLSETNPGATLQVSVTPTKSFFTVLNTLTAMGRLAKVRRLGGATISKHDREDCGPR